MPRDPVTGIHADIIMDPTSISGRMNVSRLYEQYFNGFSRKTKYLVTNAINSYTGAELPNSEKIEILKPEESLGVFTLVLELLSYIDNEQYKAYKSLYDEKNIYNINKILLEILEKELFIQYTVSNRKKAYQIVKELKDTKFAPDIVYPEYTINGKKVPGRGKVIIAPLYIILLFKTGDEFLSCASAKTNHYGFPISAGKNTKYNLPWRNSPVKIASETEARLFSAYSGPEVIAELKDRATSKDTHAEVYKNILNAQTPTNVDRLVDRSKMPFGNDASLQLVNSVFNCAGVEIDYVPENLT